MDETIPSRSDPIVGQSYRHFRVYREGKLHHHGGVTLAVARLRSGKILVGCAVCSDEDMYNRDAGREVATDRVLCDGARPNGLSANALRIPVMKFDEFPGEGTLSLVAFTARASVPSRAGVLHQGVLIARGARGFDPAYSWAA